MLPKALLTASAISLACIFSASSLAGVFLPFLLDPSCCKPRKQCLVIVPWGFEALTVISGLFF